MIDYFKSHWQGILPLWQVFWINLVLVAAIPHFAIGWLMPDLDKQLLPYPLMVMTPLIVIYILVFASIWPTKRYLKCVAIRDV